MRYVDLFSGIGGFSLGIKRVIPDAQCVFACDNDKDAADTYKKNFDIDSLNDIKTLDVESIPDFDIALGGFPCQSFSRNGKHYNKNNRTLSKTDNRAELYTYLVNILKVKQPSYFLFENVKGLLTMKTFEGDSCFDIICSEFYNEAGYDGVTFVTDTADYGLPQQRKRVFFLGIRKDLTLKGMSAPIKIARTQCVEDILDNNVDEKYYLRTLWRNRKCLILRDKDGKEISRLKALENAYNSGKWTLPGSLDVMTKVTPLGVIYGDTPSGGPRQQDKLYSKRGISPTIATFSTPSFDTNKGWRILTPRECARLQGFPESFRLPSSDYKAYKQIGNAVSTNVIQNILQSLLGEILYK